MKHAPGVGIGLREELLGIDALAERGVQSMRMLMKEDSRLGSAMIENLREIQVCVSRAMSGLSDSK